MFINESSVLLFWAVLRSIFSIFFFYLAETQYQKQKYLLLFLSAQSGKLRHTVRIQNNILLVVIYVNTAALYSARL